MPLGFHQPRVKMEWVLVWTIQSYTHKTVNHLSFSQDHSLNRIHQLKYRKKCCIDWCLIHDLQPTFVILTLSKRSRMKGKQEKERKEFRTWLFIETFECSNKKMKSELRALQAEGTQKSKNYPYITMRCMCDGCVVRTCRNNSRVALMLTHVIIYFIYIFVSCLIFRTKIIHFWMRFCIKMY
jgi:hypothetical protein